MVISELIKILQQRKRKHGDIKVIQSRYSDYQPMTEKDISVRAVVPVPGAADQWIRRASKEEEDRGAETCLHFDGN